MAAVGSTKISWRLQEFEAHTSSVSCLSLGKSSGRLLATGGEDCRVNIWAVSKTNCIMSLTGSKSPIECLQLNASEEKVIAGSQSGSIKIWDLEAAKILRPLMGHKANITSLGCHPLSENFLASSSMDTNIKLWDVRRKGYIFRYQGHTDAVRSLAFSPDGKWLASASDDCTVKLWDIGAGKAITEFKSHSGAVNIVQFHPNEYLLASGSADRTIKLWDLEKFSMVGSLEGDTSAVRCVFFSQDGACLFSGSSDTLRVFGWEPDRCFDVVSVGWGKVSDLSICNQQLGEAELRNDRHSPEGERRSPSEDEGDEKLSSAEIHNADDYKEIFQPKNAISRTPPKYPEPFPAPPEDESIVGISRKMMDIAPFSEKKQVPPIAQSTPVQRVEPTVVSCAKRAPPPPTPHSLALPAPPSAPVAPAPAAPPGGDVSDKKGHDTMCVMLSSRHKNLDSVRGVWSRDDIKRALDTAVSMNDLAIVVDILNIINLQPSIWKLDLCMTVLPQIDKLLQSKYESYIQTGCTSLRLIMKHFWSLISDTLKATPSVGVDITREERHQKCRVCCKQLKNLSNIVKNKSSYVGRHGSVFKELQLLMAPLDDAL
ncbi:hypothetical protein WMY93_010496 [Mugilogobius chulae]|uniref:Katanin p80 WD40 repeat-containing subunit B1 n=1 Tax=Mugilogobius chulae TaxID=88201 RepID=A0AAW0PB64_9GOBI